LKIVKIQSWKTCSEKPFCSFCRFKKWRGKQANKME
jgi:hypothetical protein